MRDRPPRRCLNYATSEAENEPLRHTFTCRLNRAIYSAPVSVLVLQMCGYSRLPKTCSPSVGARRHSTQAAAPAYPNKPELPKSNTSWTWQLHTRPWSFKDTSHTPPAALFRGGAPACVLPGPPRHARHSLSIVSWPPGSYHCGGTPTPAPAVQASNQRQRHKGECHDKQHHPKQRQR